MNKAIWITGAFGFIGRHLARYLAGQGCLVAGIGHGDWPNWGSNEPEQWGLTHWFKSDVDYAGFESLGSILGPPAVVFHLAGGSSVGYSQQFPHLDFERTAHSVTALLEWVRNNSSETPIVLASSAAVYGTGHETPIAEDSQLNPFSPYGFHKRIAELQLQSYSENYHLRTAVVRLFSVYGAGLRKQLLWDLSHRLSRHSGSLELFGTGQETRDFIHVEDAVRLLHLASDHASIEAPIYNGGTGIARTVHEVALELCRSRNQTVELEFNGQQRAGDPTYLVADSRNSKAIGFDPSVRFEDGLADYSQWFLKNAVEAKHA